MTSNSIYIPYTYCITFIPTGERYYGSKYANRNGNVANPKDFWVTYFTSSKIILNLISEYGKDAFTYQIRKTFTHASAARNWEHKFLTKINAAVNPLWLNRSNSAGSFNTAGRANYFYINDPLRKIVHLKTTDPDVLSKKVVGMQHGNSFSIEKSALAQRKQTNLLRYGIAYPGSLNFKKGIPKSEITKQKMRKPKSESHKQSMRKPKSEAHKQNLSANHSRRQKIKQYTLTGELVSQFTTIKEGALSQSNIPFLTARTCISAVCRGHRDSFNGFIWKYD